MKNIVIEDDDWSEHKQEKSFIMQSSLLQDTTADSGQYNTTQRR